MGDKYTVTAEFVKEGDTFSLEIEKGSVITKEVPEEGYLIHTNRANFTPIFVAKRDLEKAETSRESITLQVYK